MLSPETIKKGTVLMCHILAFPTTEDKNYQVPNLFPFDNEGKIDTGWIETDIKQMLFHKSWDWLHRVIDEIHESYAEVHLLTGRCTIIDNGYNETVFYLDGLPIENAFCAISDYLQWLETPHEPITEIVDSTDSDLPF